MNTPVTKGGSVALAEIADIETPVVKWAERRGIICLKLNNPWCRGYPDRLFVLPNGVHIYIEFKWCNNKPSKLQQKRMQHLKKNNCIVTWTNDPDWAIQFIEGYL